MGNIRNVVLITIDCLRADHLPIYGYQRDTAPFLTELAEKSVLFENSFSTGPGTSVSFPSIFTGTYPFEFGGYSELSTQRTPIASVVSNEGVDTIGVHSNTYLSRTFGYQRGFDIYESFYNRPGGIVTLEDKFRNFFDENGLLFTIIKQVYESIVEELILKKSDNGVSLPYKQANSITDTAISHLSDISAPFFSWIHYMDVHAPHHPPNKYFDLFADEIPDWKHHHETWLDAKEDPTTASDEDIQQFINAYDAEIRFVDEQIERLFNQMKQWGNHENTLYILTADHGELLGEHGQLSHPPRLYNELLHVPLILHHPNVNNSHRSDDLVSLIDIPTTIAKAFNAKIPDTYKGQSLLPATMGKNCEHDMIFAEVCHEPGEGMSTGKYRPDKSIVLCRSSSASYVRDLQRNSESFDVAANNNNSNSKVPTEIRQSLQKAVDDHINSIESNNQNMNEVDISAKTAERLRDLGYAE
jgi:arylsulfatase A-like enzyme